MSESSVCPHARQAARDAFRDELAYPEIPDQLPTPGTDQALELDATFKPYFYGKLSQGIGLIATYAMQELPPERLNWRGRDRWQRLGHETQLHMVNARKIIRGDGANDELFGELEIIHGVKKQLRPQTYSTLDNLIDGGASAYSSSALPILRDMHRSPEKVQRSHQVTDIFKKSSNQLRDLASVNIEQFAVIRHAIGQTRMPEQRFNHASGIMQLETSLPEIPVSQVYHGLYINDLSSGETARSIGDIKSAEPIIGCPILLTPKLVGELWEYTVDSAVDRRLV